MFSTTKQRAEGGAYPTRKDPAKDCVHSYATGNTVRPRCTLSSVDCKLTPVNTSLSVMTETIQYLAPSINLSPNPIPLEC